MKDEQLRQTGIGVVGDVLWGTHFFLFHETKEDLIDACIPYFKRASKTENCACGGSPIRSLKRRSATV
jgi:hypothetical protein